MSRIRLALFWHHHQPFYKDLASGVYLMPWVRLHGTKDYYGMARMLERAGGGVRATINLVPSLLEQLEDYVEGRARDVHLELSTRPAAELSDSERATALDLFFMANADRMIRPSPRYGELLAKRRVGKHSAEDLVSEFSDAEYRDLQVWANLAWFHRTLLEEDEGLRSLVEKDREFTEDDKVYLLGRQREVLAEVLPLHRKLMEAGVIELTTSPFYHPILPLLVDASAVRVALPNAVLPKGHVPLVEDARWHLESAARMHERLFGERPAGLWPSEGSVSPGILPLVKGAGFRWLASDEQVLAASALGRPYRPEDLYRPWRLPTEAGDLSIVFRDHRLSDLVGFDYKSMDGRAAARDFVSRVRDLGRQQKQQPLLVTVVLDGENAWEHYPRGGIEFLEALYGDLSEARDIETVRIGEALERQPPTETILELHSGSWINRDFGIWMGQEEDIRAWEYLYRVRRDLVRMQEEIEESGTSEAREALAVAWRSLYIAEGSDWTWWYGDDHNSGQDDAFDRLYRTHLQNVYRSLGRRPPEFLDTPVPMRRPMSRTYAPDGILRVSLEGRPSSYFEWLSAGRYRGAAGEGLSSEGGSMQRASSPVMEELRFGFDEKNLFVRLDLVDGWRERLEERSEPGDPWRLLVRVDAAAERILEVPDILAETPQVTLDGIPLPGGRWVGIEEIVELGCPLLLLGLEAGDRAGFHMELRRGGVLAERLPGAETVNFTVPGTEPRRGRWPGERLHGDSDSGGGMRDMPELRKDPIIGRWVIIAEGRLDRPSDLGEAGRREAEAAMAEERRFCPFCPGNERKTPPEIFAHRNPGTQADGGGWRVRVVPNKFPVLRVEGQIEKRAEGMYDRMRGIGAHEVFIETPDHVRSFTGLEDGHVLEILTAYQSRMLDLRRDGRLKYGMLFKNVGLAAGASLEHTHSQLIVTPVVPRRVAEEIAGAKRYFEFRGRCVYCDILDQELSVEDRRVMATERFAAVVPYASRFPFETWIMPRAHNSHFEASSREDLEGLAYILKRVLKRIETSLERPPYNYMLHTAPFNSAELEHYHWHIEIIPRVTRTAGFEWGTGFYINPVRPEDAAAALREAGRSTG